MPFIALAIGFLIVLIDQIIKYFVSLNLKPIATFTVIENIFNLTYVENKGVAFGMFKDMRWIFIIITSILLIAIIVIMFVKRPTGKLFYFSASLIIGGGIGNLIDRVLYGYVIDYLSFSFFPPVCNFADYCITIGTVLLMVYVLFFSDLLSDDSKKVEKINE